MLFSFVSHLVWVQCSGYNKWLITLWAVIWFTLRFENWEKDFSHKVQENGLSPLCDLQCFFGPPGWQKDFLHREQLNSFTPVWYLQCIFRLPYQEYNLLHWEQENGFSPVWDLQCLVRSQDREKEFVQRTHKNGFSPVWVFLCLLRLQEKIMLFYRQGMKMVSPQYVSSDISVGSQTQQITCHTVNSQITSNQCRFLVSFFVAWMLIRIFTVRAGKRWCTFSVPDSL